MKFRFAYLFVLLLMCSKHVSFAQGTQQTFGKNRVQHHNNFAEWSQYESEGLVTFWYGESRAAGQIAAMTAELDFAEVQQLLDYRLNSRIELIVYSDITDLHQSNIGASETFSTAQKGVKVVGSKAFIHFDGSYDRLRRRVREGIAGVFLNAMLLGSNWQEVVQNAVLLSLPDWFKEGLVSYAAEDWNTELDNQLRNIILSKKYKNFEKFAAAEPRLAGHAFWYFIAQQYGRANVSNLLYLTRINRSIEDGFLYVLGNNYEQSIEAMTNFYQKKYESETSGMESVENAPPPVSSSKNRILSIKNKLKLPITTFKISPDGRQMVYVLNELGRYKIYVQNIETNERQLILKGGSRNAFQQTDYNYPLVAWHSDNQQLGIITEKRDVVYFTSYELATKKKKTEPMPADLQRIFSVEFTSPRDILITAASRGVSDIFTFNIVNRNFKRITNDIWDDLDAVPVKIRGKNGILFASNRLMDNIETEKLDTVLPINRFDIFYKDLDDTSRTCVQVTRTPDADERFPNSFDETHFTFLSNQSGITNRQKAYLTEVIDYSEFVYFYKKMNGETDSLVVKTDSSSAKLDSTLNALQPIRKEQRDYYKTIAIASNLTNYNRNIAAQNTSTKTLKTAELIQNAQPYIRVFEVDTAATKRALPTAYHQYVKRQKEKFGIPLNLGNRMTPVPALPIPKENPKDTIAKIKPTFQKNDTAKPRSRYLFQAEFEETNPVVNAEKTENGTPISAQNPLDTGGGREIELDSLENNGKLVEVNVEAINETKEETPKPNRFANFPEARFGKIKYGRTIPYGLRFKIDDVVSRLDNSLLFGGLDSYAGVPQTGQTQGFSPPPTGYLVKGVFKDLLEDYQLEIGARLPVSFDGGEYFMIFDNKKKQLDQRYAVYHRSRRFSDNQSIRIDNNRQRAQTTLGYYELRYPFDVFTRLQAGFTVRNDRFTSLATDARSLNTPSFNEQRLGVKLEYVFDNALDLSPNLRVGVRAKVFGEIMQKMNIQFQDNFQFDLANGTMSVLGFDVRKYWRLDKRSSIFAVRGAGTTTLGSEKILHYMGGVDQAFFGGYESSVSVPNGNYAFQTLAANLRGFGQNIRNGTNYALINAEIRVPMFRYFSSRPLRRAFWRDFQVVGFFDVGTAWHGITPFAKDNPLNTITISNPTSVLTVSYFKDPLAAGYGVGVHLPLPVIGFARVDYAWGIETRQIQSPRFHFSIGYDF